MENNNNKLGFWIGFIGFFVFLIAVLLYGISISEKTPDTAALVIFIIGLIVCVCGCSGCFGQAECCD